MSPLQAMHTYKKKLKSMSDLKLRNEGERFATAVSKLPLNNPEHIAAAQAMTMMIRNEIMRRVG